jgi:hypothetical protein
MIALSASCLQKKGIGDGLTGFQWKHHLYKPPMETKRDTIISSATQHL